MLESGPVKTDLTSTDVYIYTFVRNDVITLKPFTHSIENHECNNIKI